MNPEPYFTHDCERCILLATVHDSQRLSLTDSVRKALTAGIENPTGQDLVDAEYALGVRKPEWYDLYYCPQGTLPTVIARYGDEGEEYKSGLQFGERGLDRELTLAYRLALKAGLIERKPV